MKLLLCERAKLIGGGFLVNPCGLHVQNDMAIQCYRETETFLPAGHA